MPRLGLATMVLLGGAGAAQGAAYKERVFLDNFDQVTGMYSGRVIVTYEVCNDLVFGPVVTFDRGSTVFFFDNAKNERDALAKKQAEIDQTISRLVGDATACPVG